jgi:hypothetical protein
LMNVLGRGGGRGVDLTGGPIYLSVTEATRGHLYSSVNR